MMTDAERRDVARRLRGDLEGAKSRGHYCSDSETVRYLCKVLGFRCSRCLQSWRCLEVLADLIEPSGHECVPGECPINVRHDNDRIDRDALLELADECDSVHMHKVARRIREALGEAGE